MQPCHIRPQVERSGERCLQAADKFLPPLRINTAHLSDVAGEVSLMNELGQCGLSQQRSMPIRELPGDDQRVANRLRRHDESYPQARKKDLGKSSYIQDDSLLIQA